MVMFNSYVKSPEGNYKVLPPSDICWFIIPMKTIDINYNPLIKPSYLTYLHKVSVNSSLGHHPGSSLHPQTQQFSPRITMIYELTCRKLFFGGSSPSEKQQNMDPWVFLTGIQFLLDL